MTTTNISQELKQVLIEKEKELMQSPSYPGLKHFLSEMERKGLLKKPEYTLPLVDTLGKNWYHSKMTRSVRYQKIPTDLLLT